MELNNSGLVGVPIDIDKSKRSNISHFAANFAKFDQFYLTFLTSNVSHFMLGGGEHGGKVIFDGGDGDGGKPRNSADGGTPPVKPCNLWTH